MMKAQTRNSGLKGMNELDSYVKKRTDQTWQMIDMGQRRSSV